MQNRTLNSEISNLVFNWIYLTCKTNLWDLTEFYTDDGKDFTKEYLDNIFQEYNISHLPEGWDETDIHILIDPDTKIISIIPVEDWCRDYKGDDYLAFSLELDPIYFTINIKDQY